MGGGRQGELSAPALGAAAGQTCIPVRCAPWGWGGARQGPCCVFSPRTAWWKTCRRRPPGCGLRWRVAEHGKLHSGVHQQALFRVEIFAEVDAC